MPLKTYQVINNAYSFSLPISLDFSVRQGMIDQAAPTFTAGACSKEILWQLAMIYIIIVTASLHIWGIFASEITITNCT